MKKNLFVSFFLMPFIALAEMDRIQSMRFDRSSVKTVYLAPGLGSVVLFPCPLLEVFVGRSQDLKTQISPSDKKTLFLNLKLNSSLPTNLIARCEGDRNIFVFDVLPSRVKHQDVVEIRGAFGGPGFKGLNKTESSGEAKATNRFVVKNPILVEAGASK